MIAKQAAMRLTPSQYPHCECIYYENIEYSVALSIQYSPTLIQIPTSFPMTLGAPWGPAKGGE